MGMIEIEFFVSYYPFLVTGPGFPYRSFRLRRVVV
jgi:hypothetical protein